MYSVFRNLAIIILSAKFFGLVARKFKAPQVVGEIVAACSAFRPNRFR